MYSHGIRPLVLAFWCTILTINYCSTADATTIASTFDEDDEGWTLEGSTDGPHYTLGGLPLGHICGSDTNPDGGVENVWYFSAPQAFLGDISRAYGSALSFRLKTSRYWPDGEPIDVLIRSGSDTISLPFLVQPGFDWTPYRAPLEESAGWVFFGTEMEPTADQIQSILSNVTGILIRADFGTDNRYAAKERWGDTGCLDDVALALDPAAAIEGDVSGNIKEWAPVNLATSQEATASSVCAYDIGRDGSDDPWYWKAPREYLGDISGAYGKALTFDLKTTRYQPDGDKRDVLIHGNGVTVAFRFLVQPGSYWTPYRVPLDASAGWVFFGTDERPTEEQMKYILSSVTDILIRPDFGTNNRYADSGWWDDTGCLTNVVLELKPVRPTLQSPTSLFNRDNEGWVPVGGASQPHYGVSAIPPGHACATDTSTSSTWVWKAPASFLGDVSASYGSTLGFDIKSTAQGGGAAGYAAVYLRGNDATIFAVRQAPTSSFSRYSIFLDTREAWRVSGSAFNDLATAAQIQHVLSSLTDILILGDYYGSNETSCLDNVVLGINSEAIAIQRAYVAYYGRPADVAGGDWWSNQLALRGGHLGEVIQAFGNSAEFTDRYGNLSNSALIDSTYRQLLGREPDIAGKDWYLGQLDAGRISLQTFTLDVLGGANQGIDKLTVENKLEVALYYTTRLRVTGADYAIDEIVSILNNVTSDYASVISAKAAIEALL